MKDFQTAAAADTLYEAFANLHNKDIQLSANIEVVGGTVNIYGSQGNPTAALAPTAMSVSEAAFEGITSFGVVPNYLFFETQAGTPVITLTAVRIVEVVDP